MLGLICLSMTPTAWAGNRHLSIIIDTSGSMSTNDPRRYTLQLSQILGDLLETGDSMTVTRMPASEQGCNDGPNPSLSLEFSNRNRFQRELDPLLVYNVGTYFAAPIHTAIADLQKHRDKARLLLFIADSGGLGACDAPLTKELSELRAQGVMLAAVNLGGAGAFDANPAFHFTRGAVDTEALVKAVAEIYQKFIGTKTVQQGRVNNPIEVDINPWVRNAFLVVAADGPFPGIEALDGNPGAEYTDSNHQGGGYAMGLDSRRRDYHIFRLKRPQAGHWRFMARGLKDTAGWMLVQDSALALRLLSPNAALNVTAPLEVELYDQDTGLRVTDTSKLPGLNASVTVDGQTVHLRDDGQGGDKQADDGILSADVTFHQGGRQRLPLRLESDALEREAEVDIQVETPGWLLQADASARAVVESPVTLSVRASPNPALAAPPPPLQGIDAEAGGRTLANLRDDGKDGDKQAGDNVFTAVWTPQATGDYALNFKPVGGSGLPLTNIALKVTGSTQFGPPLAVDFGKLGSNSERQAVLDLSNATVKGEFALELSSAYDFAGSALDINLGQGWVTLDSHPKTLTLTQNGPRTWPVRLRVADCPAGVDAGAGLTILLSGVDADNQPVRITVPLKLEIAKDPWLHCWWPLLAAAAGALAALFVAYGFWSPARFAARLGVMISPEEDISEGFFHPIRAQRGTGSGFYRDARAYIRQDYCLSGKPKAALAVLRASAGNQAYIRPAPGASLFRLNLDGEWEALPSEETLTRFGVVYKDAMGSLFFEIRNG